MTEVQPTKPTSPEEEDYSVRVGRSRRTAMAGPSGVYGRRRYLPSIEGASSLPTRL